MATISKEPLVVKDSWQYLERPEGWAELLCTRGNTERRAERRPVLYVSSRDGSD